jgi:hypothetical protein
MATQPSIYSILVIDAEGFYPRDRPTQDWLQRETFEVVRSAAHSVGTLDWDGWLTTNPSWGTLMLIPPSVPPDRLVGSFVDALDEHLARRASWVIAENKVRLRVALHQGPVELDEHFWQGEAVLLACRLVNARPLHDALKAARDAHAALIVSDEIYQSAIRHQHGAKKTRKYVAVLIDANRPPHTKGWITVPGYATPPVMKTVETGFNTAPASPIDLGLYSLEQGERLPEKSGDIQREPSSPQSFRPPGPEFTPPPPPRPPPPKTLPPNRLSG